MLLLLITCALLLSHVAAFIPLYLNTHTASGILALGHILKSGYGLIKSGYMLGQYHAPGSISLSQDGSYASYLQSYQPHDYLQGYFDSGFEPLVNLHTPHISRLPVIGHAPVAWPKPAYYGHAAEPEASYHVDAIAEPSFVLPHYLNEPEYEPATYFDNKPSESVLEPYQENEFVRHGSFPLQHTHQNGDTHQPLDNEKEEPGHVSTEIGVPSYTSRISSRSSGGDVWAGGAENKRRLVRNINKLGRHLLIL